MSMSYYEKVLTWKAFHEQDQRWDQVLTKFAALAACSDNGKHMWDHGDKYKWHSTQCSGLEIGHLIWLGVEQAVIV